MARAVPAASQALRVLRYLASRPRPVSAAAVARDLDLPRSSVYHLLTAMIAEGFVAHLPEEHRYGLGVAAFEVGSAYLRHDGLERLARPLLGRLVDEAGANGHLGVLDGRDVLYLLEERPRSYEPLVSDVGVRLPAHLTASGRALLAHLPAAQIRALYPDAAALVGRTGLGPATPRDLRRLLAETRTRGHATEDGEVTLGYASIAAAAFDHTGRPVAGVAITVRSDADADTRLATIVPAVTTTAAALTARLHGVAPGSS
ncbi:MAG: IclR family transcriptional regulator [Nitriliruptoraceae bacterium]